MKISTVAATLALGCVTALALTSCTAPSADTGVQGKLNVVATTTQLTDFATQVGGDDIALTGLLTPGGSAHHFDPTPADLLQLGKADVLIVNGAGLDEFIDSAIDASGFTGTIIDASKGVDLAQAKEITLEGKQGGAESTEHDHAEHDHAHEAEHGSDHDGHSHEGQSGSAHGDEAEHDHDHGDLNPHLWTSPRLAQGMVGEIASGLAAADSAHAADYTTRAEAYQAQLTELDSWIRTQYDRVPAAQRVLVTGHDSLRYYLHDYGIGFAGSLLPSFEDNAEPSAAEIDALVQAIKQSGVKAIFVESSLSPKLADTVAKDAGITVAGADSLFVDSLGPKGSGAETYIAATVHNTSLVLTAWGATVDPVPNDLQSR